MGKTCMDRSTFVKGAALVGTAAAGVSLLAGVAGADETPVGASHDAGPDYLDARQSKRPWAFEVAPDSIDASQIAETVETDVVVLGAGTSGLVTAFSALQEGLDVAVVSASTAPVSRGGSNNAVYSKAMERLGCPRQSVWHVQKEIAEQFGSVSQALWFKYWNNSETAMDWLIDIMEGDGCTTTLERSSTIADESLYSQATASHAFLGTFDGEEYSTPGSSQQLLVLTLAKHISDEGGRIFYSHKGLQLIRGGRQSGTEGRVTGVVTQRMDDGTYVEFDARKAVVLATGDFSHDRDMMARYAPQWLYANDEAYDDEVDYDARMGSGGLYKGDGHKMALWCGAAWQKNYPNALMGGFMSPGPNPIFSDNFPGLLVNRDGARYMDEYTSSMIGGRASQMQPGGVAYAIWDAGYASAEGIWFDGNGIDAPAMTTEEVLAKWDSAVESGRYVRADTLEELVEALGLPIEATLATVERYNSLCHAGEDEDFHKDPVALRPVEQGPFYGASSSSGMLLTVLGGLRTNTDMQVCDADDNAIPGLYCVGTMVGDFYAGLYTFQMQGVNLGATCITFGYLTGKHIAATE